AAAGMGVRIALEATDARCAGRGRVRDGGANIVAATAMGRAAVRFDACTSAVERSGGGAAAAAFERGARGNAEWGRRSADCVARAAARRPREIRLASIEGVAVAIGVAAIAHRDDTAANLAGHLAVRRRARRAARISTSV